MKLYEYCCSRPERVYSSVYSTQCKPDILSILKILCRYGYHYVEDYFDNYVSTYDESEIYADIEFDKFDTVNITSSLVDTMTGSVKSYHLHHLGFNMSNYGWVSKFYRVPYYHKKVKVKLGWCK